MQLSTSPVGPPGRPCIHNLHELLRGHLPENLVKLTPLPELERRCHEIVAEHVRFRQEVPPCGGCIKINAHQKAATTRQGQRLLKAGNPQGLPGVAGPGNGELRGFAAPGCSPQPAGVAVQRRSRAGH